jgi:hypothetical protein
MDVNDQKAANALYLALKESMAELCMYPKTDQELAWTAYWLFNRMKKHYNSGAAQPGGHEGHEHG